MARGKLRYPETPTGDDIDRAAGVEFADPYRWLEQENEAVHAWQAAQNRLTDEYVRSWPHFAALKDSVHRYFVDRIGTLPRYVAGRWFRTRQLTNASLPCIAISGTAYGEGRELSIPVADKDRDATFLSWLSPSPDGRIVAVGVCSDGSENNRIQLIDVESGERLPTAPPQMLMDAWTGGACWLPDSSGFYFLALQGEPREFKQVVLFHDLASGEQRHADIPLPDPGASGYTLITLSRDGRYLVASHGLQAPKPIAIRDLAAPGAKWRPFVTEVSGTVAGFVQNDRFIAVTDVGAARGRLVAIPLDAENPNDVDRWSELLSESDFVLRSVTPIADRLYVTGFVDTYSQVRILDQRGKFVDQLQLPGRAALVEPLFPLMNLIPSGHPDEYYFVFSSLTESWGVYRHLPDARAIDTIRAPQLRIENAVVEDHWALAADGVRIPYHTVHLAGIEDALPAPALIYAYGAFNLALLPEYPGAMAAFIAAGGIYVHGHIRGGAELGLDWWRAGRLQNKQNGYNDLYAIAEDLIEKGLTTHAQLAMTGRSNGGLMAGVAATQRPDLWRAIVSQVPVTDLIGVLRDPYGRDAVAREYGNPNDPDEVVRLSSFSPYHLVKDDTAYPAVFVTAGATDPRCPPWHARKLAARLQAASKADAALVLLRVRENAGHGLATPRAAQLSGYCEWLAFLMRELRLQPKHEDESDERS